MNLQGRSLSSRMQGKDVHLLQTELVKLGYNISSDEIDDNNPDRSFFGDLTQSAVIDFQKKNRLPTTGVVDENTARLINKQIESRPGGDAGHSDNNKQTVEGHVFFEYGLPANSLAIRLYQRGFGGSETLLGEVKTDDQGYYKLPYDSGNKPANLEVRLADANGKEIVLSEPKLNADGKIELNLVAPAKVRPLAPEYTRLVADIEKDIGGSIVKLADAQEKGDRRDFSLLYQSTGWDARLTAMLAKATKNSIEIGISQDALYALYRMGFPTDKQLLASTDPALIEKALEKAKKEEIVSADLSVENTKKAFLDFSRKILRDQVAPGALSSFGQLLDKSVIHDDDETKRKFEEVYRAHSESPAELWKAAAEKGISSDKIQGLQLQGKLAYLTLNNALLAEKLQQEVGTLDNVSKLADLDLYKEDAWKTRLATIAPDDEALKKIIPSAYENAANPVDAYVGDLARKVRLSFPTRVVGRMIEKGELKIADNGHDNNKDAVSVFLKKAEGLGFELGRVPLEVFVRNNEGELFAGITSEPEKIKSTKESVKRLQRLYQITPSNEALGVLLNLGFDSAHDVAAFSEDEFVTSYGPLFSSINDAKLVFRKAQQVTVVTYNFFTTTKLIENTPPVHVLSLPAEEREKARNELIKYYPTMETLFGSLDFCECEHCRSVLSPAAYLVDLLKFLEPEDQVWKSILNKWKNEHQGERYLKDWTYDNAGEEYEDQRKKPYYALTERRPDLSHIPLTCENTNTALPYIDITNEILEYYVANNNALKSYRGYDTSADLTTPELLAEPQNILPKAYDVLKDARYPLSLPFDLWLETVRMFFEHFEVPFWKVLQLFHNKNAELFAIPPKPAIENPTNNNTNATLVIPDSDAPEFRVGLAVTYYDVSATALHPETKTVLTVGAAGSGGGPGKMLITLSGLWATPPVANDLLVVAYGNYSMSSIFNEYLGISSSEYSIFINPDPLAKWYELYGYETDLDVLTTLKSAKALARQLGITYKDLAEIVQTGFVNPELAKLALVWKLHLNVTDIVRYFNDRAKPDYATEKLAFEAHLSEFDAQYKLPANSSLAALEKYWTEGTFKKTLVLRDTSPFCNFDKTYFEFAVPADESLNAEKAEQLANLKLALLKINLFVRLRKKLGGWTIEETDRALQVLFPKNISQLAVTDANFGPSFGNAFRTALVYMSHLKSLDEQVKVGKGNRRQKLLALWSDLAITGKKPLYADLFLTRNILKNDPVFDDPLGKYLSRFDSGSSQYVPFSWDPTKPEDQATGNVSLINHLPALQAALNLTADDIEQILVDANKDSETEPLTLANVSLIYRYGLLAKALKLSIKDLITLKELSGIDPFKALEPNPITSLSQDYPFEQTLRFIEDAKKVKESGLTLEDLGFLLSHRFSPIGKYRFNSDVILGLVNTIANEIQRIQDEGQNSVSTTITTDDLLKKKLVPKLPPPAATNVGDFVKAVRELAGNTVPVTDTDLRNKLDTLLGAPASNELFAVAKVLVSNLRSEYSAVTDDIMKQKLGLVLPSEVVDKFFGFWKDTIEFSAKKEHVDEDKKLDPATYEVKDGSGYIRVSYDPIRSWQQVIHVGVLTNDKKNNILAKVPSPDAAAPQAQKDAYNNFVELINLIAAESQPQPEEFFDKYFEGFLTYDDLYGPTSLGLSEQAKRHKLFATIMPFVQQKLIRQFVVQTLASNLSSDPALVEQLLTNKDLLTDPDITNNPGKPLLDAFAALGYRGVDAKFFDNTGTQLGQPMMTVKTVNTSLSIDNIPIKPSGATKARFNGYFVVPKAGDYRFFLALGKQDAEAEFTLHHLPDPLIAGKATNDGDEISEFVELKPGILYRFSVNVRDLKGGDVSLLVQSEGIYKNDGLSQLALYPQTSVDRAMRAYVLLTKIIQIIKQLTLSEREVRHIFTHRSDFENIDLSKLPTVESDTNAASPVVLFKQFLLLTDYAHLKRELSAGTDDLIAILENASRTYTEEIAADIEKAKTVHFEAFANLTYRESAMVRASAERLGFTINATLYQSNSGGGGGGAGPIVEGYRVEVPELAKVEKLWLLWEALQIVEKLGAPIDKIASWAATPAPDFHIAQDLRNTINARYEPENWQRIAQSIFDKLRQRKRDALVAYIMHKEGFERIEQLFEYFLIDPGMEPVVQTSRIRLAISSVQLFIQRSLLNLEKRVRPVAINSKHWQWMKRYRVWEANRKIFLFPENWLEPEFRDDKTHIFQELESALLQGDVSNDLVEDAFFNYLKKLEELAKLDIVTIYCEEKADDPASNTLHVIGRTVSQPHKYFYRHYTHQMWTPWEPVTAEIEGDHVVAVIWKERLHLFWVTFLEKPKQDSTTSRTFTNLASASVSAKIEKEVDIQLSWSQYYQGQWTTRESSGFGRPIHVDVDNTFDKSKVFIFASLRSGDGSVLVNLGHPINRAFRVVSKNDPPKPMKDSETAQTVPYSVITPSQPTKFDGSGDLKVTVVTQIKTQDSKSTTDNNLPLTQKIIQGIGGGDGSEANFSILPCMTPFTLIDKIRNESHLLSILLDFIPVVGPSLPDVRKRLDIFAESLSLQLSNPSLGLMTAISNEWKAIRGEIVGLDELGTGILDGFLEGVDGMIKDLEHAVASGTVTDMLRSERRRFTDPFFYQDEQHSFLVEPTLTEKTIIEWDDWVIRVPQDSIRITPEILEELPIEVNTPARIPFPPEPDPEARFRVKDMKDWVTDPSTVLVFDDRFIGKEGGLDLKLSPSARGGRLGKDSPVVVNHSSKVLSGRIGGIVADAPVEFRLNPDSPSSARGEGPVNIVSSNSMNPALLRGLGAIEERRRLVTRGGGNI